MNLIKFGFDSATIRVSNVTASCASGDPRVKRLWGVGGGGGVSVVPERLRTTGLEDGTRHWCTRPPL